MLDLGSGVAGGARGWVADRAGLGGVPPTWVWVVGVSPQILEHPTSICDTGVNDSKIHLMIQSNLDYPDYSIIRTFFSGPNFFMNIN